MEVLTLIITHPLLNNFLPKTQSKKDMGMASSIGLLLTSHAGGPGSNLDGGLSWVIPIREKEITK